MRGRRDGAALASSRRTRAATQRRHVATLRALREVPAAELRPGGTLGPYRLEELLGEGALGVVFRATPADGRTVAVKVLKPQLSGDALYEQRFWREARVAADVRHPRLVRALEAGVAGGRHYLAAEYVPGGSLEPPPARVRPALGGGRERRHARRDPRPPSSARRSFQPRRRAPKLSRLLRRNEPGDDELVLRPRAGERRDEGEQPVERALVPPRHQDRAPWWLATGASG